VSVQGNSGLELCSSPHFAKYHWD